MIIFLKFVFYISVLFLIIISLYPGSLLGYLLYGDLSQQPNLFHNPFGYAAIEVEEFFDIDKLPVISINHFICYVYVSLLGFFIYSRKKNFQKLVYSMFFLAAILELLHLILPNRSLQLGDLIGNILGVIVAYFVIKIYLLIKIQ